MAKDGTNWEALLKWSLGHADGTQPPRQFSEEDRKWFMEAMQTQTIDVIKRMKEITLVMQAPDQVLEAQGVTSAAIEDMLDELQEDVESIDMANALIRHNKPGIAAFCLANGYAGLRDALESENVRFQRKALNLVQYLLHENHSDYNTVNEFGFPRIMMHLAASEDTEVREAALRGLIELACDRGGGTSNGLSEDNEKLKQILQDRLKGISLMSLEDLVAAREERQLVDSLWNACYNEPSPLQEKGLLVLPGEDGPSPDVAGKIFEPPLEGLGCKPISKSSLWQY
ncbi:hypothetical protein NE237_004368 [Protea cynaroides]|uniref:Nucleotide exchange factor Fes1 domain-containing protein n=1 Tax=Protea cynaroides TaxID=273540 RepID=A0A9Q0KIS4_9MAGN|nr:hypothetical protein NE237_004368 [Protea cynaroides]